MWLHLDDFFVVRKEFTLSVWLKGQQGSNDVGPVTWCLFVISKWTLESESTYLSKHPSDISCINCLHSEKSQKKSETLVHLHLEVVLDWKRWTVLLFMCGHTWVDFPLLSSFQPAFVHGSRVQSLNSLFLFLLSFEQAQTCSRQTGPFPLYSRYLECLFSNSR